MKSIEPIPFLSGNARTVSIPQTIHSDGNNTTAVIGPAKADLHELILKAVGAAEAPIREEAVCQWLIDHGDLPPDYITAQKPAPGGPYGYIRGHLVHMSRNREIAMERDIEGRAVYSMIRKQA